MDIKVLFFGDVVGEGGREALAEVLPGLREEYQPDLVIANIENATHGRGVSASHYAELKKLGIDAFTSGDHIWRFDDILPILDKPDCVLVRPANYIDSPGKGFVDLTIKGKRIRVISLMGRVFMQPHVASPFEVLEELIALTPTPDAIIVDFHAEATSEKRALAEFAAGRVQLQVGTHTHVPTADAQVLDSGTAFISDLGMCGPTDSILGVEVAEPLKNFLTGRPWRYTLAKGRCELGAAFCTIDLDAKRATHLEHIRRFT